MRDRSIDAGRGLLVIAMVYGHVMQFFGDSQIFPLVGTLTDVINLLVFPTFVFYFGATAVLAYLKKPYISALPGMARTALRSYAVFCLSGVGYRVLRENKAFAVGTVRRVMQLTDIPGWSEFLIAFALYALLMMVGYAIFDWLSRRMAACLFVSVLCVGACLVVPYGRIPTHLALLVGGRDFAYFPVVQYMPYFLAGMLWAQGDRRTRQWLLFAAVVCSLSGVAYWHFFGFPGRFPPTWGWILLPAALVAAVVLISRAISALAGPGIGKAADALCGVLGHFGGASLYYLLGSNLVLFTLAGKGIAPAMARKSVLPWTMPIQSPQGAACWTLVLLLVLWFVAQLCARGNRRKG
ncbi:MAG: hypothetical protein IKU70_13840 [Clostridia bacterium]|nr:hypothetical protein [Clostridia bacterium]